MANKQTWAMKKPLPPSGGRGVIQPPPPVPLGNSLVQATSTPLPQWTQNPYEQAMNRRRIVGHAGFIGQGPIDIQQPAFANQLNKQSDRAAQATANARNLNWTQYGVGGGVAPVSGGLGGGRSGFVGEATRGLPQNRPAGAADASTRALEMWFNELPGAKAYYSSLSPEAQKTIAQYITDHGWRGLSDGWLRMLQLRQDYANMGARQTFRTVPPDDKEDMPGTGYGTTGYGTGYGAGYGNYGYGGGGGYNDYSPYTNWLTNLTNWNID